MKGYLPIVPGSVTRRTVRDLIGDEIESLISSGVLRVGDRLPSERDLAAMLNVSRETVRRSIRTLEERGIVKTARGTRARIADARIESPAIGITGTSSIKGYSVDDVYGARVTVERTVIMEAARNADQFFIDRLEGILSAQQKVLNDTSQFYVSDRSFHVTIYRQCGNKLLSDIAVDLYTYMLEKRRNITDLVRTSRGYEDHLVILAALKAGDPDRAADALEFHLDRQRKTSHMLVEEEGEKKSVAGSGSDRDARPRKRRGRPE